jgi:hypothetical protein
MKNALFLLLLVVLFASCKKDKPDPDPIPNPDPQPTLLKMELTAWFEDEVLEAGKVYHNVSNYRVNVTELKLYLAHVHAVRDNGEIQNLTDIAFFDLTNGSASLTLSNVPPGNYTGLGFGIGVPQEMNSPANPGFNIAIYDSNHPLSVTNNMYWTWATGYRFVIFDGRYDVDAESDDPLINGYSFHTGMDESYREVHFNDINFAVTAHETNEIFLDFAVDRFYYSDGDTIDVAVDNQSHGTNQQLSDRVSDHIQQAVSFR